MASTIEDGPRPEALRDGYPAAARWISHDPDGEALIFRKFDQLAIRNLLHLQCQILDLEAELEQLDAEARKYEPSSLCRHETFVENSKHENERESKRMKFMDELDGKIKKYHEALILQAQVAHLERPRNRPLTALRNYLTGQNHQRWAKPGHLLIHGKGKSLLENKNDLVALHPKPDKDALSQFLQDHWPARGTAYFDARDSTTHIPDHHVVWAVSAISITIAAILLIGAIASLFYVTSSGAKLGLIATFTLLFALSVFLLTNAKRPEIFAATAAYAAVLVVFISGNIGDSSPSSIVIMIPANFTGTTTILPSAT